MSPASLSLVTEHVGAVLHLQLNRPAVHNALDGELVERLTEGLAAVRVGGPARVVLLSGAGPSFCAGADLGWMQRVAAFSRAENLADARRLAGLMEALNGCPLPTVARVQGAAFGGGLGLLACCDVVLAADDTRFAFSEAKLGLLPAVISPYIVAKIGESQARALFASGQRFDAGRALRIGLVHQAVPAGELDAAVARHLAEFASSAPGAAAAARALIWRVRGQPPAAVVGETTALIAGLRASAEGREGLAAFLEKRRPAWAGEDAG